MKCTALKTDGGARRTVVIGFKCFSRIPVRCTFSFENVGKIGFELRQTGWTERDGLNVIAVRCTFSFENVGKKSVRSSGGEV